MPKHLANETMPLQQQLICERWLTATQSWHDTAAELDARADEVAARTGSATLGRGAVIFAESATVE